MRHKNLLLLVAMIGLAGCSMYFPYGGDEPPAGPPAEQVYSPDQGDYPYEMDYSGFYDTLSPYGIWVSYRPYGYVWVPGNVGYQWRPYSNGRWLWTDYGWTWIAREQWGWIPFHYGRWGWDRSLGWFWVPGSVWAPAWVTWRWGDLYIGWAPLPPGAEFAGGMGIRGPYDFPDRYWVFVEGRYFQHDYLDRYTLPFERNLSAMRFTVRKSDLALRNRQIFNDGVDVDEVRRLTRTAVPRHELEDARGPGDNNVSGRSVRIYRPALKKNEAARPKSYMQQDEAEKSLPRIRETDPQSEGGTVSPSPEGLKDDQDREKRILERSQQEEKAALRRRVEDEQKKAATPAERQRVSKEGEVKAGELRKAHDEEKAKVEERHQQEKKVIKGTIRKKEGRLGLFAQRYEGDRGEDDRSAQERPRRRLFGQEPEGQQDPVNRLERADDTRGLRPDPPHPMDEERMGGRGADDPQDGQEQQAPAAENGRLRNQDRGKDEGRRRVLDKGDGHGVVPLGQAPVEDREDGESQSGEEAPQHPPEDGI